MASIIKKTILAASFALISFQAQADYIIDTGTPSGGLIWSWSLGPLQQLGLTFEISSTQTITSIEGYFLNEYPGESLTISLYAGASPDSTSSTLLYESSANMQVTQGWDGFYGLDWSIGPGTYSLAFIPYSFSGHMPIGAAFYEKGWYKVYQTDYWQSSPLNLGFRIASYQSNASTVPEPESMTILLAGLGLLSVAVRRNKHA